MRMSSAPEKSAGVLRPLRYFSKSARPARKDSAVKTSCQRAIQRLSVAHAARLTMLLMCVLKDGLVVQKLFDLGEQRRLLVVMVRLDELEPGKAVANKVGLVLFGDERGLVIDGVVAAEDRVVWSAVSVPRASGLGGATREQGNAAVGRLEELTKRTKQGHVRRSRRENISLQTRSHQHQHQRDRMQESACAGWRCTFLVWNWGVVTSFKGPSAHGCDGATEVIVNGARVSRNPRITKGMERMNLVLRLSMVGGMQQAGRSPPVSYDARPEHRHWTELPPGQLQVGACR